MYVILAQGTIKQESTESVLNALREMVAFSNSDQEPGCLLYVVHQSSDDSNRIMLYEQYTDEAAFEDHKQTDMFKKHVAGTVVSGLEAPFQVDAFVEMS